MPRALALAALGLAACFDPAPFRGEDAGGGGDAARPADGGPLAADAGSATDAAPTDAAPPPQGALSVVLTDAGWTNVVLSTEGALDWAHWGRSATGDFNHKAGADLISTFTRIGDAPLARVNCCADGFTWTGGAPTANAADSVGGVYVDTADANGDGFRITVDAATTDRRLRLYTGGWCARFLLAAALTDASASPATDLGFDIPGADGDIAQYTVDFRAASDAASLIVDFVIADNHCTSGDVGEAWLYAATLADAP